MAEPRWRNVAAFMKYNDDHNLPILLGLSDTEIDALDLAAAEFDEQIVLAGGSDR